MVVAHRGLDDHEHEEVPQHDYENVRGGQSAGQELLGQASRSLDAIGVRHGLIAPGHSLTYSPVQVASVHTLFH